MKAVWPHSGLHRQEGIERASLSVGRTQQSFRSIAIQTIPRKRGPDAASSHIGSCCNFAQDVQGKILESNQLQNRRGHSKGRAHSEAAFDGAPALQFLRRRSVMKPTPAKLRIIWLVLRPWDCRGESFGRPPARLFDLDRHGPCGLNFIKLLEPLSDDLTKILQVRLVGDGAGIGAK